MTAKDYVIVTIKSKTVSKEFISFLQEQGYKNKSNLQSSRHIVINKVEKSFDTASINVLASMVSHGVKHVNVEVFNPKEEKQF